MFVGFLEIGFLLNLEHAYPPNSPHTSYIIRCTLHDVHYTTYKVSFSLFSTLFNPFLTSSNSTKRPSSRMLKRNEGTTSISNKNHNTNNGYSIFAQKPGAFAMQSPENALHCDSTQTIGTANNEQTKSTKVSSKSLI